MIRTGFILIVLVFFSAKTTGQHFLEGHWEGTITTGGIYSREAMPFELILTVKGRRVEGRSFIYINKDEVIEMSVTGYIYEDRSVGLVENQFFPREGSNNTPPFFRKFQFVYSRGFWETGIEGYWQQVTSGILDPSRDMGRIKLNKAKSGKA